MRGDRPELSVFFGRFDGFTPHARGSTFSLQRLSVLRTVYPACAGIDPVLGEDYNDHLCLPRMRGDRPRLPSPLEGLPEFTPHARGSTF